MEDRQEALGALLALWNEASRPLDPMPRDEMYRKMIALAASYENVDAELSARFTAIGYEGLGSFFLLNDNPVFAGSRFETAARIREELAEKDGTLLNRFMLAAAYRRLGLAYARSGEEHTAAAGDAYQRAAKILLRMSEAGEEWCFLSEKRELEGDPGRRDYAMHMLLCTGIGSMMLAQQKDRWREARTLDNAMQMLMTEWRWAEAKAAAGFREEACQICGQLRQDAAQCREEGYAAAACCEEAAGVILRRLGTEP